MQKEQDREAIYRSIFFCDMDRKKADEIINRLGGRTVTYDKGEIIIREREKRKFDFVKDISDAYELHQE